MGMQPFMVPLNTSAAQPAAPTASTALRMPVREAASTSSGCCSAQPGAG